MACGANNSNSNNGGLVQTVGNAPAGSTRVSYSFTGGPVTASMSLLVPTAGSAKTGAGGWLSQWNQTLQDYTEFAPVHRGMCNILMADGSVQGFNDNNNDRLLNNGFPVGTIAPGGRVFRDSPDTDLPQNDVYSSWSLHTQ